MKQLQELLISSAVLLSVSNIDYSIWVVTDSSAYAIGDAMYQAIGNKIKHLVFIARNLSPSKQRWRSSKQVTIKDELSRVFKKAHLRKTSFWLLFKKLVRKIRALCYLHFMTISKWYNITKHYKRLPYISHLLLYRQNKALLLLYKIGFAIIYLKKSTIKENV